MSSKAKGGKGKGGKSGSAGSAGGDGLPPGSVGISDAAMIEALQAKLADGADKLARAWVSLLPSCCPCPSCSPL